MAQNLPPRYDETIVLYVVNQSVSLELTNYEDVLLKDGNSSKVVTLRAGYDSKGKTIRRLLTTSGTSGLSIGSWLDVPEVIKFQQKILSYCKKTAVPAFTSTASFEYGLAALQQALLTIGFTPGTAPSDSDGLINFVKGSLKNFADTTYRRSDWVRAPGWKYNGETPGLLNPDRYADYENNLRFTGYFPRPRWVLEEERTVVNNQTTGGTTNFDARKISPIKSKLVFNVDGMWKLPAQAGQVSEKQKEPFQRVFERIDAMIKSQAAAPQAALPPGTTPASTLHCELKRINCYAFRGDSRAPGQIFERQGFFSNVTRTEESYAKDMQTKLDTARTGADFETYLGTLVSLGVLHLGNYITNEKFGGFISTTKSLAIAKCFSGFWMAYAAQGNTGALFNTQNFCYAMRCVGGFHMPSDQETRDLREAIHTFAHAAEQEVAVPGMIGWNEIVGFRMCRYRSTGPFLAGPVWLLSALPDLEPNAFKELYAIMSGKSQGLGKGIEKVYPTPPWGTGADLPMSSEV